MHGVQPKANAKPSRKPLQIPGCPMLLRRRTTRLSHLAMEGPRKPMKDSAKKCIAPKPAKRGACRKRAATPSAANKIPMMSPVRMVILISTPSRCNPKSRIHEPAMGASQDRFCRRKEPTTLADAPEEMRTAEKPARNDNDDGKKPERGSSPFRDWCMPIPESMEM